MRPSLSQRAHRWNITVRVFAAVVLGYILANTASIFIGFILPMEKPSAVVTAAMSSFAIYTCIIAWIFHVKTLRKMWGGLALGITVTASASWLLYLLETRA